MLKVSVTVMSVLLEFGKIETSILKKQNQFKISQLLYNSRTEKSDAKILYLVKCILNDKILTLSSES